MESTKSPLMKSLVNLMAGILRKELPWLLLELERALIRARDREKGGCRRDGVGKWNVAI